MVILQGSSPHTRDKLSFLLNLGECAGIIPAYAGQTLRLHREHGSAEDHPRIRGTNKSSFLANNFNQGSSPHTRDKPRIRLPTARPCRIIPAYAGQTLIGENADICAQDHPRIRGTNEHNNKRSFKRVGSSPHTRDKPYRRIKHYCKRRIIPAYAGQTGIGKGLITWLKDHPRIRGTNTFSIIKNSGKVGSSPHTRDKLVFLRAVDILNRIIPAYAGQTIHYLSCNRIKRDHPRIRGTNLLY